VSTSPLLVPEALNV